MVKKRKKNHIERFREENGITNCFICGKKLDNRVHHCMCNNCHLMNECNSQYFKR
jgi:hypothetical protein